MNYGPLNKETTECVWVLGFMKHLQNLVFTQLSLKESKERHEYVLAAHFLKLMFLQ